MVDPVSCQPLLEKLTNVITQNDDLKHFSKLKTVEEKVRFLLSDNKFKHKDDFINIREELCKLLEAFYSSSTDHEKSEEKAESFKLQGTKAFMKKNDAEAVALYTDGLRVAPFNSSIFSILYANRSAALFQMKKYEGCLQDIERAILSGYPMSSIHKVIKRKIQCLIYLGRKEEAENTLDNATEKLFSKETAEQHSKELRSLISTLCRKTKMMNGHLRNDEIEDSEYVLPKNLFQTTDSTKPLSDALEIRQNTTEGRHLITSANIPAGVPLFCENPFAAILLPEFAQTHCQHCFKLVDNPVPCESCIDVLWCSENCRSSGSNLHSYECLNLHILWSVGVAHLALRIVTIAGKEHAFKVKREFESKPNDVEQTRELFLNAQTDVGGRYESVYSLLSHIDEMDQKDLFQYMLASIILSKVLQDRTSFLGLGDDKTPWKLEGPDGEELATLLTRHVAQLVSNAHAVTQVQAYDPAFVSTATSPCKIAQKRIACGVYPVASLMNHSCKPAIINSFCGATLLIYSTEDIESGQKIYNCYGPHACRQDRKERQKTLLQQYFFSCECNHCTKRQVLIDEATWSGLKCVFCTEVALLCDENKRLACLVCGQAGDTPIGVVKNCSYVSQTYDEGEEFFKKEDFESAYRCFKSAVKVGEKLYTPENEFLNTMRDKLAETCAIRRDYEEACRQVRMCVRTVQLRFGADSVEAAHELLKFLSVSQQREKRSMETNNRIRNKVVKIFTTHYGPKWKSYLKLKEF